MLHPDDLELIHEARDSKKWIQELKFSLDGNTLAVGSRDNKIYLYDVGNGFTTLLPTIAFSQESGDWVTRLHSGPSIGFSVALYGKDGAKQKAIERARLDHLQAQGFVGDGRKAIEAMLDPAVHVGSEYDSHVVPPSVLT